MSTIHQVLAEIKGEFSDSLNGRTERAAALAMAGAVKPTDRDYEWTVQSQTDQAKVYTVGFNLVWSCTCEDHLGTGYNPAPAVAFGGGVQPTCKHILAAAACYFANEYPAPPAFDLVIATKKQPFISESNGRILWIKRAGCDKIEPKTEKHLTDSDIAAKLAKYTLIDTEARQGQVIRRYRLVGGAL